jgi:hypothetical protein
VLLLKTRSSKSTMGGGGGPPTYFVGGEDTLARRRGGWGVNILEDERDRIALLQYIISLRLPPWRNLEKMHCLLCMNCYRNN